MKFSSLKRGFTLIELLVVVSIIALLSSIVMTALATARQRANDSKVTQELRQVQIALTDYYNDNSGYPNPGDGTWCIGSGTCLLFGQAITPMLAVLKNESPTEKVAKGDFSLTAAIFPTFDSSPSITINGDKNRGFLYVSCGSAYPVTCPINTSYVVFALTTGIKTQYAGESTVSNYVGGK